MENLWIYLPFLVPVVFAQFGKRYQWAQYATYGLLILINLGLLGLAVLSLLNEFAKAFMPQLLEPQAVAVNWLAVAIACLFTSMLAFMPLIPHVRRWLARWMDINPDSIVHTAALTLAIYQIGLSLGQMALIGDLENLTDVELALTVWDVLLSGLPLVLFALLGVGLFIRRDGRGTLERLGLRAPTWKQLLAAVGITLLLLGLDFAVNLGWQEVDPDGFDLLNRVTENIFGNLITVGGALALGLSAGISEELLFRGAVQPRLGLLVATLLFTLGHLQYGLTLATIEIFVIGLVLGLVRNRASTTICIVIHASYNTANVLLGMV
jgi:membrane protease YdiL (CAAX protease family)